MSDTLRARLRGHALAWATALAIAWTSWAGAWAQQPSGSTTYPLFLIASAPAAVTIASTGVFQQGLAVATNRKGCLIQYIGAALHVGYVDFRPTGTAATATSFQLQPGQSMNCNFSGIVMQNAISLTGTTGDVFMVSSQ